MLILKAEAQSSEVMLHLLKAHKVLVPVPTQEEEQVFKLHPA